MTAEEEAEVLPDMAIAQLRFQFSCEDEFCPNKDAIKTELLGHVEKDSTFVYQV